MLSAFLVFFSFDVGPCQGSDNRCLDKIGLDGGLEHFLFPRHGCTNEIEERYLDETDGINGIHNMSSVNTCTVGGL